MQHAILFVDDDPEILDLFRHMLRRQPFAVEVARTGAEAFDVLAARTVAVVIADERMPGMSGTELLARVQVEYPATVRMMITGQPSLDVAMRAINEGQVYRFLTKPVRATALVAALHEAIAIWETQRHDGAAPASVKRRRSAIEELESEWQGLTHVERDAEGAVVVPESESDPEAVLREMQATRYLREGQRRP